MTLTFEKNMRIIAADSDDERVIKTAPRTSLSLMLSTFSAALAVEGFDKKCCISVTCHDSGVERFFFPGHDLNKLLFIKKLFYGERWPIWLVFFEKISCNYVSHNCHL